MNKIKKLGIGLLVGIFFIPTTYALFGWNLSKVDRFMDFHTEYEEWQVYKKKMDTKMDRDLFYAHCEALEEKLENEEEIKDIRFLKPCEDNNIQLYFEVRNGFTPVGR